MYWDEIRDGLYWAWDKACGVAQAGLGSALRYAGGALVLAGVIALFGAWLMGLGIAAGAGIVIHAVSIPAGAVLLLGVLSVACTLWH